MRSLFEGAQKYKIIYANQEFKLIVTRPDGRKEYNHEDIAGYVISHITNEGDPTSDMKGILSGTWGWSAGGNLDAVNPIGYVIEEGSDEPLFSRLYFDPCKSKPQIAEPEEEPEEEIDDEEDDE